MPPVSLDAIRSLIPIDVPTAVVQYTLTRERGIALIVTRDDLLAVTLPELNERQAFELARAWFQSYYRLRQAARGRDLGGVPQPTWDDALPTLLEPVAERAVRPVVAALAGRGIKRLILSPNRALHVFPLHASLLEDGQHLCDAFEMVYTPSLSILHRCATRRRNRRDRLLLLANPTGDLLFTEVDSACLAAHYRDPRLLRGKKASKDRLFADGASCHVLHYTGHSVFSLDDPLASALVLGDKNDPTKWLTLREVFCGLHLSRNLLTVISGCESGMLRPDRVDEYVGLPSGFLYAGAPCVVSSLWAVYALSSALLMDRFHEEWHAVRTIAAALHNAQRWLRDGIKTGVQLRDEVLPGLLAKLNDADLERKCREAAEAYAQRSPDRPPFASPAHWAPFAATGLCYPLSPGSAASPSSSDTARS